MHDDNVFVLKQTNTSPALRYALEPDNIELTAAEVQFKMRERTRKNGIRGDTVVDAPGRVVNGSNAPVVEYAWQPDDAVKAGHYEAEFEITYSDGTVETFPNYGFIRVVVHENIEDIGGLV